MKHGEGFWKGQSPPRRTVTMGFLGLKKLVDTPAGAMVWLSF